MRVVGPRGLEALVTAIFIPPKYPPKSPIQGTLSLITILPILSSFNKLQQDLDKML